MARINLYNANSLANQAVGTPGVDPTGETLMNIGSTITNATNTYIKAEAEKLDIANNIQAEVEKIKYESELYRTIEEQKQIKENIDNPYDYADTVYSTAELAAEEYAKGITNPQVRQRFEQKVATIPASAQKSATKWASDQTVTNTFVSVKEGLDHITMQAKNMTDLNGFNGCLAQGEALIANSVGVLGPEKAYALRQQMRKDIAENFIYSKIEMAPSTVKSYLESGNFDGIYDEKEKLSISKTCETIGKRNIAQQEGASHASTLAYGQNIMSSLSSGKATLSDVNGYINQLKSNGVSSNSKAMKTALAMRKTLIEKGGIKYAATNQSDALFKVETAFSSLPPIGKESDRENIKWGKDVTWEKINDLQDVLFNNAAMLTSSTYKAKQDILNNYALRLEENNPYAAAATKALSYHEDPVTGKQTKRPKAQDLGLGSNIREEAVRMGNERLSTELKKRGKSQQEILRAQAKFRTVFDRNYEAAYEKAIRRYKGAPWDVVAYEDWAVRQVLGLMEY